ncbi:MAG: hypothetical protein LBG58_05675 [Planctomycetaceae bacterium]|nr:hypothetical protein [Planctomycetaceae bacterium]
MAAASSLPKKSLRQRDVAEKKVYGSILAAEKKFTATRCCRKKKFTAASSLSKKSLRQWDVTVTVLSPKPKI